MNMNMNMIPRSCPASSSKPFSSSSSSSSSSFPLSILYCSLFVSLLVLILLPIAHAFNPLIRLPTPTPTDALSFYSNASNFSTTPTLLLNIDDFGAKGDGISDDTQSLRDVWKIACSFPLKAKIVIPARKVYLILPIDFGHCRSKLTLKISGHIIAPRDPAVWDGQNVHRWLYFHGVKHLKVEGKGTIDGMGQEWWARSCKTNTSNPCTQAPTAVTFHKCNHLKVRNITITSAQQIHVAFTWCTRVAVSGVEIIAPADSPNTDGIHISASTLVEVERVIIRTGDDCISIVSNSSRIRVQNAMCGPGHGISIGGLGKHGSCDSVQDVVISNSVLINTLSGARIKTWQGGSGVVRQIKFENILMKNVANPIIIDQYYCDGHGKCPNQTSAVRISDVSYIGIFGTSANEDTIMLACSDRYPCKGLYLKNIHLETLDGTTPKSFCLEAYGTSSGQVYPVSCLSSGDIIVRYGAQQNTTGQLNNGFAVL